MKYTKKEESLPPELRTKAAREAFDYAGEDPANAHVRWLGSNDVPSDPFTRWDFEDLFGVLETSYQNGTKGGVIFQALGKLKDGRIALLEAVTESDWASSNGVAKVARFVIEMGDYLARSERNLDDPMHAGRARLCGYIRIRLETASIREASEMADDAFASVEKTVG